MPFLETWLGFSVTLEQANGMTFLEDWLKIWILIIVLKRLSPDNAYFKAVSWLAIMASLLFTFAKQTADAYTGIPNGTILILIIYFCVLLVYSTSLLFTNFRFYGGALLVALVFRLGSEFFIRTLTPAEMSKVLWIGAFFDFLPSVVLVFCFFRPQRGEEPVQDILHE